MQRQVIYAKMHSEFVYVNDVTLCPCTR